MNDPRPGALTGGSRTGPPRPAGRRAVVTGLAALAVSRPAFTQSTRKVARIGILTSSDATDDLRGPEPRIASVAALLRGLRELGYAYGRDFVTEPRGGESRPETFGGLAVELVGQQVDVIVAGGPTLAALKQATATIPVIMTGSIDPVAQGYAHSLARPGGNFTGFSLQLAETAAKRLELLKELVPGVAPVAVLWDQNGRLSWAATEAAARQRGWALLSLHLDKAGGVEDAFKSAIQAGAGAVLVIASSVLLRSAPQVAELAARSGLPAMYELRLYVEAGGLMSYSANLVENYRRSAVFVDKLLKGAKAADLPIEQPSVFELVINLKAAKALGLVISPTILTRASELIE